MSNAGRPRAFEQPDELYEYFTDYKKATKNNPFLVHDYAGKDTQDVYREKERPLTMEGFEVYLFQKGIIHDLKDYFANTNNKYEQFSPICSIILKEIRSDQISGGMAGVYNASITQRLNGLVEKTESKVTVEQPLFGD